MPRIADTQRPEAAPCKPEPPRPAYVSDYQPVYPPIPTCCPRCHGIVITSYDESYCIPCGWRLQPLPLPQEPDMHKSGASLPSVVEVRR